MARKAMRYIAVCDQTRSRTWSVMDRQTGKIIVARLLNKDEASYSAMQLNLKDMKNG